MRITAIHDINRRYLAKETWVSFFVHGQIQLPDGTRVDGYNFSAPGSFGSWLHTANGGRVILSGSATVQYQRTAIELAFAWYQHGLDPAIVDRLGVLPADPAHLGRLTRLQSVGVRRSDLPRFSSAVAVLADGAQSLDEAIAMVEGNDFALAIARRITNDVDSLVRLSREPIRYLRMAYEAPAEKRDGIIELILRGDRKSRLALGDDPREITRDDFGDTASDRKAAVEAIENGDYVRSWRVLEWARACLRDDRREAITKARVVHGPAGTVIHGSILDRLDEIVPADLGHQGVKASVNRVMERASTRIKEKLEMELAEQRTPFELPEWASKVRGWTPLRSPVELLEEGKEMGHCVGFYVGAVRAKKSVILQAETPERATAEVSWDSKTIHQCRGPKNAQANLAEKDLLRALKALSNDPASARR